MVYPSNARVILSILGALKSSLFGRLPAEPLTGSGQSVMAQVKASAFEYKVH